ncbi:SAM-dependent methyltransferase [Desulfosarcina alkanivorans]|uniref:SAM-dependent methyltransferase n=1 Tax=Desulfosarcina alkanivorans TaxID=571177 RepID=A0A5K7YLI4_9BACT|nr:methyltransferase domain-containing protein [Desulfosarcina alkanivorans]BBO69668.1 SAM-dependent methyltransferase [Desulfosarcina alkanivorans]
MNTITQLDTTQTDQERDAFTMRMLDATTGVFDIYTIHIGYRLGFYTALARGASLTSTALAGLTGTYERYVREWLEQQTVAGIVRVENADAPAGERRFFLPAGHIEVLTDRESVNFLAPLAQLVVGAVRPVADVIEAFKSGAGVPYSRYGEDMRDGVGLLNRTMFMQQLGREWLPGIPDIHGRLTANPHARVADIGCGQGWSSIGMALAYPHIRVDGYDLDEPSVARARINARQAGLIGRVNFHVRDASDPIHKKTYDLVTAFECIHDMPDPVGVLTAMRQMAAETGSVVILDERTAERFSPDDSGIDGLFYGFSVMACLPNGMAEQPSAQTGTVMRPETLKQYALAAGFAGMEILPVEHFFFRLYRLF